MSHAVVPCCCIFSASMLAYFIGCHMRNAAPKQALKVASGSFTPISVPAICQCVGSTKYQYHMLVYLCCERCASYNNTACWHAYLRQKEQGLGQCLSQAQIPGAHLSHTCCKQSGFPLSVSLLFSHLGGVATEEVVHGLFQCQLAHRGQHTEGITAQQDHIPARGLPTQHAQH